MCVCACAHSIAYVSGLVRIFKAKDSPQFLVAYGNVG